MSIFDKFKKKDDQSPAQPVLKSKSASKKQATPLAEAPASAPVEKVGPVGESQGVFIRPLITEKASVLNQFNQYVFEVSGRVNKIEIARAFESRYGVKPLKVRIINHDGKFVRFGRSTGRTKNWKKAIIVLPAGKTIQVHEGV